MTENERLKLIRTQLGLTQRVFSEALEIKQGSYSDVERGKAGVSALLMKNLIRKYRVNPLWLCEGEGTMFIPLDSDSIDPNSLGMIETVNQALLQSKDFTESESNVQLIERQQHYIENLKSLIEFLHEE